MLVDTVNDIPEGSACMINPMKTMTKAIGSMKDINSNNEYADYTVHLWTGLEDDTVDPGGCGGWTNTNCVDSDNGATDIDGDGCDAYFTDCSGAWDDDDFSVNDLCCLCGGGI